MSMDPRDIPRPAMFPMAAPAVLTTSSGGRLAPEHTHYAYVNAQGNGVTNQAASHFHFVRGREVVPSMTDGHTHKLTAARCGAGRF